MPSRLKLPENELKKMPGYHGLFLIEPEFRGRNNFGGRLCLSPDALSYVNMLAEQARNELSLKQAGYEFLSLSYFMQIIAFLSRAYSRMEGTHHRAIIRLGEIMSHIEKQFRDEISVGSLCEMAAMSRRSFFRTFQMTAGCSPAQYILNLRISHASKLLKEGYSVKESAFRSGFRDSNYLSRQFRKIKGVSPSNFKGKGNSL